MMNPYFSQQPDNILAASLPAVYPNISEPITDSPLSSLFQKMFPLTRYHSSGPPASPKSGIRCVCNVWSQPVLAQRSDQRSTGKLAPTWKFPTRGEPFPSNTKDATVSHCPHWQFREVRVAMTIITRMWRSFNSRTCPTTASPLGRQFRPYQNPTGLRADYANRVCAETRARHGVPIDSLLRGCQEVRNSTHWQKYRPPLGSPYNFQKFHW